MKFCHISDTHLGFSAFRKTDPKTGFNQREVDVCKAFSQAIDKIISLKPDFVLHTGDLFDSSKPANRIVSFCLKELLKLAGKTKVVIISGNHSTPRMTNYGSVFELFEFFPELSVIYKGLYEKVDLGATVIHAVPQCLGDNQFHDELKKIKLAKDKYNILAVHAGVAGGKYSMNEFGETLLPSEYLEKGFDYIAMGHYHMKTKLNDRAYYSGSTERMSFNEAKEDKGFLFCDLKNQKITFMPLKIRPMVEFSIDATDLDHEQLNEKIAISLKTNIKNAVVKMKIDNLPKENYKHIDNDKIKELTSETVQFVPQINLREETDQKNISQEIGNLEKELIEFIKEKNQIELTETGLEYLKMVTENAPD